MKNKITLAAWARKNNISRQLALNWANAGRLLSIDHPTSGVWLIDENEQRPIPLRPWHKAREEQKCLLS
jgi:hypothetical protein